MQVSSAQPMFRNDLEACLGAYQFAELLLGGFLAKDEKERTEALQAAERLRDDAESKFLAAIASSAYSAAEIDTLKTARARLHQKLTEAGSAARGA